MAEKVWPSGKCLCTSSQDEGTGTSVSKVGWTNWVICHYFLAPKGFAIQDVYFELLRLPRGAFARLIFSPLEIVHFFLASHYLSNSSNSQAAKCYKKWTHGYVQTRVYILTCSQNSTVFVHYGECFSSWQEHEQQQLHPRCRDIFFKGGIVRRTCAGPKVNISTTTVTVDMNRGCAP